MIVVWSLLAFVLAAALAFAAREAFAERTPRMAPATAHTGPLAPNSEWATRAGDEFAGLSEAARCDLVFALSDLDDARAESLLVRALEDPSETVALAAAHALVRRGSGRLIETYAAQHPGARARRIVETLALLDS